MPKALDFTIGGSSAAWESTLNKVENLSARSARKVASNFRDSIAQIDSAMARLPSESTMLPKLAARRRMLAEAIGRAGVPITGAFPAGLRPSDFVTSPTRAGLGTARRSMSQAFPMFIRAGRDTLTSLASGAPITQVLAQQLPKVIQGLSMMRLGLLALKTTLVGAGLAGIAYFTTEMAKAYIGSEKLKESFKDVAAAVERLNSKVRMTALDRSIEITENIAAAGRRREMAEQDNDVRDASAARHKAEIKRDFQMGNSGMTEKEMEKKLLEIDLRRAQQKLEQEKNSGKKEERVLKAQAELDDLKAQQDELFMKQEAAFVERNKAAFGEDYARRLFKAGGGSESDWADRDRMMSKIRIAEQNLDLAKKTSNSAAIDRAAAEVARIEGELNAKDKVKKLARGTPDVTDLQRINGGAVGNAPLLDVNRSMDKTLKSILGRMSTGGNINNHFGGRN